MWHIIHENAILKERNKHNSSLATQIRDFLSECIYYISVAGN